MQTAFSTSSTSINRSDRVWGKQFKHHHPLKIIALGDSLVYGFGDFIGGGWVERLRRQWMSPDSCGHILYNLGVRGDRVAQVSRRLEQEFNSLCLGTYLDILLHLRSLTLLKEEDSVRELNPVGGLTLQQVF